MSDRTDNRLPIDPRSYWLDSVKVKDFGKLEHDIEADVVIVGGGITGITSAYLLINEGLKVVLLEAGQLMTGTTGHTTAKITAQHDVIYDELIQFIGKNKARLYYEANTEAHQFIKQTVEQFNIDCAFSDEDAYIYATTQQSASKLEQEMRAYEQLGIEGQLVDHIPFNIPVQKALIMKGQAQFHPLQYLNFMIDVIIEKGGQIYEQTTAVNVKSGDQMTVFTRDDYEIKCDHVLACTHFPFYEGLGFYSTRLYADRSYAIAVKSKTEFPGGMYLSADTPARSMRSVMINDEPFILIVGENHKTGQGIDTMAHYEALADFAEQALGIEHIAYRWSAQDLTTLDKVPYVGAITSRQPNILVATGYRKWGMTNGTAAALLLKDIVLGNRNMYEALYSPSRFYVNPSLKNFLLENASVVEHLIKGKLDQPRTSLDDIANDQGAVVKLDGQRKGAYRDAQGELHIVDTTCTHVGCEVEWNSGDRTWDCPCHGSRFSYTGEVINGPAEKPLSKYDYKLIDNLTSKDSGY